MRAKLLKLEVIWAALGKRAMIRSIVFSMLLALIMPVLYIIQDIDPCELAEDSVLFFGPRGPQIKSRKYNVEFYSAIYGDLINHGLLLPGQKGLCVGTGARNSARALRSKGIPGAIVARHCDLLRFPFADASFDFVYSGWSLDRARAPALHVVEIERTLKPGGLAIGLAIVVVIPRRLGKDVNLIHSVTPIVALFRNAGVAYVTRAGNSSMIALRKRGSDLEFAIPCGKHNSSIVNLAEPPTQNHTTAVYLPSLVDITSRNRHVYVEVGVNSTASRWFAGTYPKQNKTFHVQLVELDNRAPNAVANFSRVDDLPGRGHGFEWAREPLRKEDFIVVKVGFEHVRGMIDSGAICLVDEIFVVCNHNILDSDCTQLLLNLRRNGVFAHKW